MTGNHSIHLPGLNGLRAIAALTVMWGHVFLGPFGYWGIDDHVRSIFPLDGVTLFFVVSGFLITYLLLNEKELTGNISVKKFYIRRILRIWPLYYAYLIVALIVTKYVFNSEILYYIFFGANIPFALGTALWPVVHYWSLGVEEQFYMFWPWVVKKSTTKNLVYIILAIMFAWIACKLLCWTPEDKSHLYRFFAVTRFDCMMLGALGAILYHCKIGWFLKIAQNRLVADISVLLLVFSQWLWLVPAIIQPQIVAIVSLMAIVGQLTEQKPFINLENRIMDGIGKTSYGIYVIHPLLIYYLSAAWRKMNISIDTTLQITIIYVLVTVLTMCIAQLSYRYLERPFLKLKVKYAVVSSQSSMSK